MAEWGSGIIQFVLKLRLYFSLLRNARTGVRGMYEVTALEMLKTVCAQPRAMFINARALATLLQGERGLS